MIVPWKNDTNGIFSFEYYFYFNFSRRVAVMGINFLIQLHSGNKIFVLIF